MKTTYIYGIHCLAIGKYIYVGKASDINIRFKDHLNHSHNDCVCRWVSEKGGSNFQVEVLEEVSFKTSKDWIKREGFFIAKLREEGHPLCNKNDGGGGATEVSEEVRVKISKKIKASWTPEKRKKRSNRYSGEGNPMYGKQRHHTKETKAKQAKRTRELWTPERRKAKSEYMSSEDNPMRAPGFEAAIAKIAKPYPAFYNIKSKRFIKAGHNLFKLCKERSLNAGTLWHIQQGNSKQTRDGWRLATESEIAIFS